MLLMTNKHLFNTMITLTNFTNPDKIRKSWSSGNPDSLFYMKITASVTKSSHQDCGWCFSHLTFFFLIHMFSSSAGKQKSCYCYSPQQIRAQTTVQWYILQYFSSMWIGFNMINKHHTLPIVYTMLVKF